MPQRLIVVQHHVAEPCGEVTAWAAARGVILDVYRADLQQLPIVSNAPVLLLGGPYPLGEVPNRLEWLHQEQLWLAQIVLLQTPIMGICLGAQLLCIARGGAVRMMSKPEVGWTQIAFADGTEIAALQWHDDECHPPEDARILGTSRQCATQVFGFAQRLAGAQSVQYPQMGIQFHPEWNAAAVERLNAYFATTSPLRGDTRDGLQGADEKRFAAMRTWFWITLDAWSAAATLPRATPKREDT